MTFVIVTCYICHLDLFWVWLYNGVITKQKNKGDVKMKINPLVVEKNGYKYEVVPSNMSEEEEKFFKKVFTQIPPSIGT